MQYNDGDKVRIREDLVVGERYDKDILVGDMKVHLGKQATITYVSSFDDSSFRLDVDNGAWWWTAEMLEPIEEEPSTTPNNIVTIDLDTLTVQDKNIVLDFIAKSKNPFNIPIHEHTYYYINTVGRVVAELWQNTDGDNARYFLGNYFLTKQEAEFEVEKRKILRKLEILSKKAGGVDWSNTDDVKYSIRYNHYDNELRVFEAFVVQVMDRIYFPTEESLQEAINLIGESNIKKYIFGVED